MSPLLILDAVDHLLDLLVELEVVALQTLDLADEGGDAALGLLLLPGVDAVAGSLRGEQSLQPAHLGLILPVELRLVLLHLVLVRLSDPGQGLLDSELKTY